MWGTLLNIRYRKLAFYTSLLLVAITLSACSKAPVPESIKPKASSSISQGSKAQSAELFKVYKTPTCGCCGIWVDHLNENGILTTVENMDSLDDVKKQFKLGAELQSCHTGVSSEGYFFEGHIPAKFIAQFLENPPEGAAGLTVPGMPIGSPGMEVGDRFSPYEILLVTNNGATKVYASISSAEEQF